MIAAARLAAALWLAAAGALDAPAVTQKIAVEVRGPVACVEVTRTYAALPASVERPWTERLVDVALPDGAALVDLGVSERGKWRDVQVTPRERATKDYLAGLDAHGVAPAREPFDDSTTFRVRVAGDPGAPLTLRYRFSLLPESSEGRWRIRFPGAPERDPVPADVTAAIPGARDVTIGGVRAGTRATKARTSTRSGWEISWAAAAAPARLEGSAAFAKISPAETLAAVAVAARGDKPAPPPASVLFVVDRSRSVGLAGLAAENDLAGRLLEALPPSTRFDALFFDRDVRRLFPMSRPATREALSALEAEMVPDRLRNGTDLAGALREAGALLRREGATLGPRAWVVLLTDGALPAADGAALDATLGAVPGLALQLAAFVVRPVDDDPAPAAATRALRRLAAARGGVARELAANELADALPLALDALARGGDVADVRLAANGAEHAVAPRLAPGEGRHALLSLAALGAGPAAVVGVAGGARVRQAVRPRAVDAAWLSALAPRRAPHGASDDARALTTPSLVALVEVPVRAAPATDVVRGTLDRQVVRNTLALAYMPRARACYLNRTAATPAERDLTGRVRLAIDLTRGEVGDVVVQSSTLNHPGIEACLRDGAFALDVPRTLRSDSPSTAVLNLVFRPRTPERHATPEEAALGAQIDLVIEELHRDEPPPADETPPPDRSMIPTR